MECSKPKKIIIAIDGFSSCGKSTFAKTIAAKLGYIFIDTGAMYRAVTLYALEHGAIVSGIVDEEKVIALLDDKDLNLAEYSDELVRRVIERVTVLSREEIVIRLVGGIEMRQRVGKSMTM